MKGADLSKADLRNAFLNGSHLGKVNLSNADLRDADFSEVNFTGADLTDANLERTNLKGAVKLSLIQLCTARTLYQAKLDSRLGEQVKEECPQLLVELKR
jgi:uncharacterized protein YjbI with pentapeptide repeats